MKENVHLDMADYAYTLPPAQIALYPVHPRDESKLLVFRDGKISHTKFKSIIDFLPKGATLVFNDTRVIPARLLFKTAGGASIELFLIDPVFPSNIPEQTLTAKGTCSWTCMIGNRKRWKDGVVLIHHTTGAFYLTATLLNREEGLVEFNWQPDHIAFAEILSVAGHTPLPPYIKRADRESDKTDYQTVYSKHEGAVAAPTAGLHFTSTLLEEIKNNGFQCADLTLHVSAGTFQPVKGSDPRKHTMHTERLSIPRKTIETLLQAKGPLIPVGTTAVRTLESLYWYGLSLMEDAKTEFAIRQDEPAHHGNTPYDRSTVLKKILERLNTTNSTKVTGTTSIMIMPGYTFQCCDAIITNFHQPGSTLLLLVSAFIGENWKIIYENALTNNYRFLSYGDSSLVFPPV